MPSAQSESNQPTESGIQTDQESTDLCRVYDGMEVSFKQNGLDPNKIAPMLTMYVGLGQNETPRPVRYTEGPEKLPENAVRLLVIPLEPFSSLVVALQELALCVTEALPLGTKVYVNPTNLLHITVFHTSRPNDPRPKPVDCTGGCDITQLPHFRNAPLADDLRHENEIIKPIVGRISPPSLTIHRALMTNTGTLILTWTDPCGGISKLRKELNSSFPGRPTSQAKIIHSTILRVLSPESIDTSCINKVSQACHDWSMLWKGKVFVPHESWFVYEETFSIIKGPRLVMPLGTNMSVEDDIAK